MEGRARARPGLDLDCDQIFGPRDFNGGPGTCPAWSGSCRSRRPRLTDFNGGPGTCPAWFEGQRRGHHAFKRTSMEGRARARPGGRPELSGMSLFRDFNGGPGTCPAWSGRPAAATWCAAALQWRAGHVPGLVSARRRGRSALQWRAGHVPGLVAFSARPGHVAGRTSMEGRARARPGPPRRRGRTAQRLTSMEGRARARPGRRIDVPDSRGVQTSMEGRARARPGWPVGRWAGWRRSHFNGGPGTCPAWSHPARPSTT